MLDRQAIDQMRRDKKITYEVLDMFGISKDRWYKFKNNKGELTLEELDTIRKLLMLTRPEWEQRTNPADKKDYLTTLFNKFLTSTPYTVFDTFELVDYLSLAIVSPKIPVADRLQSLAIMKDNKYLQVLDYGLLISIFSILEGMLTEDMQVVRANTYDAYEKLMKVKDWSYLETSLGLSIFSDVTKARQHKIVDAALHSEISSWYGVSNYVNVVSMKINLLLNATLIQDEELFKAALDSIYEMKSQSLTLIGLGAFHALAQALELAYDRKFDEADKLMRKLHRTILFLTETDQAAALISNSYDTILQAIKDWHAVQDTPTLDSEY